MTNVSFSHFADNTAGSNSVFSDLSNNHVIADCNFVCNTQTAGIPVLFGFF
jgi:hypothetical protein